MKIPSDIEIAKNNVMKPISEIAKQAGFDEDDIVFYGKYKAKISEDALRKKTGKQGKLILVTAINPTPAGEGKTTTTVGLGQALHLMQKSSAIALREPSLGPVFGVKGGAAGGGYSQVVPMDDINLHFTGDLHAITAANNLLSAMIDNHLHQGNEQNINPKKIIFKRVLDINDRALRNVVVGMGNPADGIVRQDGFTITVASEIMAILCLASDLQDLRERLGNILIAFRHDDTPVFARDIKANGAMAALLKDALEPNLVQTLEHSPCFIHGGPFANIAHGCNSVRATQLALSHFDYCVTEAGFGSDLGAEKFLDIKCRRMGVSPSCIVLVATVRALKYNGGADVKNSSIENLEALEKGLVNLEKHIENMQSYNIPVVVAINVFATDTDAEKKLIEQACKRLGVPVAYSHAHANGGEGTVALAEEVLKACEKPANINFCYDEKDTIKNKINAIATKIYGADGVDYTPAAEQSLKKIEAIGFDKTPVCIAKTQYSLSDDPKKLGRPQNFRVTVKDFKPCTGAGFVVAYLGDILTMPGLPKVPAAEQIDLDENGEIVGLF
ncbi:MAG: formate--tetrahydrofolate ligase [Clostridiales bacterium]|nr:MAG: formate--tetrahydrofolate ligase [Clostridiales bacterium]